MNGVAAGERAQIEGILARLASVGGRPYRLAELPGGLTNRNYRVTTDGADLVVRVSTPHTGLLAIDRENEYHNSLAAAEAGVGAPVVEYRPDLDVLVVGFLNAVTLTEADLRTGRHLDRVADACRRLHAGRRFRDDFDMFELQLRYLRLVEERGFRLPEDYLDYLPLAEEIRRCLAAHPVASVPCNNDLLAGNILDDGNRIWLVDYEYSGNNDPFFELGNLWSESALSPEQLDELVSFYCGRERPDLSARARLHGLMSKYGWTLWASIQDGQADIDFDFWAWGMEKYERAVSEFESPELRRLLDRAGASPSL